MMTVSGNSDPLPGPGVWGDGVPSKAAVRNLFKLAMTFFDLGFCLLRRLVPHFLRKSESGASGSCSAPRGDPRRCPATRGGCRARILEFASAAQDDRSGLRWEVLPQRHRRGSRPPGDPAGGHCCTSGRLSAHERTSAGTHRVSCKTSGPGAFPNAHRRCPGLTSATSHEPL